jgi:hypothetical protein
MAQKYIATEPLFVGYARAHNIGDVVPDENVKANGWEDGVVREGSKAAEKAIAAAQESDAPQTATS